MNPVDGEKKEGFEGQRAAVLPKALQSRCARHAYNGLLYITDIGYYPRAAQHRRERAKGCPQYILIYCTAGEGWYEINGNHYTVEANHAFLLPPGVAHAYGAAAVNPWSIYWVHFTGTKAAYFAESIGTDPTGAPLFVSPSAPRLMLFERMMECLDFMHDPDSLAIANSYQHAYLASFRPHTSQSNGTAYHPVQTVVELMRANIGKNFSLGELAAAVHLSESHLSALFKKNTTYSPLQLFTSLKMQRACELMHDKTKSIKSIAYELGYTDPYHFSRLFKKIMGISPRQFRNAQ